MEDVTHNLNTMEIAKPDKDVVWMSGVPFPPSRELRARRSKPESLTPFDLDPYKAPELKKTRREAPRAGGCDPSNKIHCKRELTYWREFWKTYTLSHTGPKIPKGSIIDVTYKRTDTGELNTERCTVKDNGYNGVANEWYFLVDLCKETLYGADLTDIETGFKVL